MDAVKKLIADAEHLNMGDMAADGVTVFMVWQKEITEAIRTLSTSDAEREPDYLPRLTSDESGDIYSVYGTHIAHAFGRDDIDRQRIAKAIVSRCNAFTSARQAALGAQAGGGK